MFTNMDIEGIAPWLFIAVLTGILIVIAARPLRGD